MKKILIAFFLLFVGTMVFAQERGGATPIFVFNGITAVYYERDIDPTFVILFDGISARRISATGGNSTGLGAVAIRNCPIGSVIIYSHWLPRNPNSRYSVKDTIAWTRAVVLQDYVLEQTIYFSKE